MKQRPYPTPHRYGAPPVPPAPVWRPPPLPPGTAAPAPPQAATQPLPAVPDQGAPVNTYEPPHSLVYGLCLAVVLIGTILVCEVSAAPLARIAGVVLVIAGSTTVGYHLHKWKEPQ